jgi:hypothetical protein
MPDQAEMLARLEADGLIRREAACHRTTRRWQAAMARAALRLLRAGDAPEDLRAPIAAALLELYEDRLDDDGLVSCIEVMLPIERAQLPPSLR